MRKMLIIFSVMIFIIANVGMSQDIINEMGKDGKFIVRDAEQQEPLVIEDGNVGITGELSVEQMNEGSVSNPYVVWDPEDKKFKTGEPISARAVARTINADRVFTVNIHEKSVLDYFSAPASDLDATKLLGSHLKSLNLTDTLILAPDSSAESLAKSAAADLGMDYDYLEKTRHSSDTVTIKTKNLDVTGRDVVLIDDMISTGSTMAESIRLLRDQGAKDVYLACVHPVLTRNAVIRLFNAGVRDIFATDTIEKAQSCVSVAPLIADAVRNL